MEEQKNLCELAGDYDLACKGDVTYVADPFMDDIHNEIVMRWLCDAHLEALAMEI